MAYPEITDRHSALKTFVAFDHLRLRISDFDQAYKHLPIINKILGQMLSHYFREMNKSIRFNDDKQMSGKEFHSPVQAFNKMRVQREK